jgi:hypothetical protein
MYEEDRIQALDLYNEIFDDVGNETAVLQLLVSPTRQAVNLARAYDAKERKLQESGEDVPAHLLVIEELRRQAGALAPAAPQKASADQISLFEEPDAAENLFDSFDFDSVPEGAENNLPEPMPREIGLYPDEDRSAEPAPPSPPPAMAARVPAEESGAQEVDVFSEAMAAFFSDLDKQEDSTAEAIPPASAQEPESAAGAYPPVSGPHPAEEADPVPSVREKQAYSMPEQVVTKAAAAPNLPDVIIKKPIVPLLILYILLAIPVTLLLIGLLLVPAVFFLGLSALAFCGGFSGLIAAFTAFSVFADILLVFGLSLALAAFGLLFFWIFIWLLIGVIPGLVRSVCALARKLCYKEVVV